MKNKSIIFFLLIFVSLSEIKTYSQDSLSQTIEWKKDTIFTFTNEIVWNLDHFGNLYIADKDQLKKLDSKGKKLFSQSLKKYGEIAKIDVRNPMKLLLFSEQQQSLFYLDNTLTKQENDIDLGDVETIGFEINYATQVSSSSQADKIWVYDQENSTINLIASNQAQSIKIENSAGLLNFSKVNQFFEANGNLWIVDPQKGIFTFDIYGTLLSHLEINEITWLEVDENYIYILKENKIIITNLNSNSKKELILPIKNVGKFKIREKSIYLESENSIFKYKMEIF